MLCHMQTIQNKLNILLLDLPLMLPFINVSCITLEKIRMKPIESTVLHNKKLKF